MIDIPLDVRLKPWPYLEPPLESPSFLNRIEITNKDALDYIIEKTNNAFRHDIFIYENYVKLFELIGIEKKNNFKDLLARYNISGYKLAKLSGVSQSLISEWTTQSKKPLMMSLDIANKIAKSLNITLDELYQTLTK